MTTESTTPKKRMDGPLDEFDCARQIVRIIQDAASPDIEAEVRAEIEKRRAKRKKSASEQIAKRMARVDPAKRENVAAHVLRALGNLGGFDLAVGSNDASPSDPPSGPGEAVENGEEELPAGAREMPAEQRERVARLTGKART